MAINPTIIGSNPNNIQAQNVDTTASFRSSTQTESQSVQQSSGDGGSF